MAYFLFGLVTADMFLFKKIWNLKNPFHPAFSYKKAGISVSFRDLKSLLSNLEPGGATTGFGPAAGIAAAAGVAGTVVVASTDISCLCEDDD